MKKNHCKSSLFIAFLFTIAIFTISCGGGGGGGGGTSPPPPPPQNAPSISNLNYSPTSAFLNDGGGLVGVDVTFDFNDPNGNISTVTISVFDMRGNQIDTMTVPVLDVSGDTSGTIMGTIDADTTVSGLFSFQMYVSDDTGLQSNILSGTFPIHIMVASNVAPPNSDTERPGRPSIGYDGNNYLVVYCKTSGTTDTMYGTLVSKTGALINSFQISDTGSNRSAVAFDGTNYLVVFGTASGSIMGQRVSTAGVVMDGITGFSISTIDSNWSPAIAYDGVNYMVVWSKYVNNVGSDIYGTRITPAGQVLGEFDITTQSGNQGPPAIAFDRTNYFVVWGYSFSGSDHIYGTRIKPDGTVLDPSGIPIVTTLGTHSFPQITYDGTNYFAVWLQRDNISPTAMYSIFGKRIAKDGTLIDGTASQEGIAINTSSYESKGQLSVHFDGTQYFVVWTYLTFPNYTPAGIYGAKVSTLGVLDGSPDQAGLSLSGTPPNASRYAYPAAYYSGVNSLLVWANVSEMYGSPKDIRGILINP